MKYAICMYGDIFRRLLATKNETVTRAKKFFIILDEENNYQLSKNVDEAVYAILLYDQDATWQIKDVKLKLMELMKGHPHSSITVANDSSVTTDFDISAGLNPAFDNEKSNFFEGCFTSETFIGLQQGSQKPILIGSELTEPSYKYILIKAATSDITVEKHLTHEDAIQKIENDFETTLQFAYTHELKSCYLDKQNGTARIEYGQRKIAWRIIQV